MSNEIYLLCERNGNPSMFKRTLAEDIMNRGAIDPDLPLLNITYSDGGAVAYIEEDEDIDSVSFGPFGGATFFQRLWELADVTGSFLHWPDPGRALAVTRPEVLRHIDPEIIESNGPPYVVRSGDELQEAVEVGYADPTENDDDEH